MRDRTTVIREARKGLLGIESLIENSISNDPPRFRPAEARALRERYAFTAERVEDALTMWSERSDERSQLELRIRKLDDEIAATKKILADSQAQRAHWYTLYERTKRFLEREGIVFDAEEEPARKGNEHDEAGR